MNFLAHVELVHVGVISSHHFADITVWHRLQNCCSLRYRWFASRSLAFSLHCIVYLHIFANTGYQGHSYFYCNPCHIRIV